MREESRGRVAVTAVGAVCPLGPDAPAAWEAARAMRAACEPIPTDWSQFWNPRSGFWAPLPQEWIRCSLLSAVEPRQLDAVAILALEAARQAMEGESPERIATRGGVFVGTGTGGTSSRMENHLNHVLPLQEYAPGRKTGRFNPFCIAMGMPNSPAATISIKFGIRGPSRTFTSSCSSGTVAIGQAVQAIRSGEVDWALAGGSEYLADGTGTIFHGFDAAATLTRIPEMERCNRPFDEGRAGFLFAAGGAAILRLEREDLARSRGAEIIAFIDGCAENCDAHSAMAPQPEGLMIEACAQAALDDAGIGPESVDYINAHGTGTEANDRIEAEMIGRLFGGGALVSTTKALTGHLIGAGGALETVICALSLRDQIVHGMPNLDMPLPGLSFARVTQAADLRHVIKFSFGFGGHNAALVLGKAGNP